MKQLQTEKRIEELKEAQADLKAAGKSQKGVAAELKRALQEMQTIQDELASTERHDDENPATYTTDELTVARAINDAIMCMKLHQLFCENHNPVLQNALRQQYTEDGKPKSNSVDFASYYAK